MMIEGRAPRVSAIIPVYNGEAFVGRAIESALAQTYAELEVIVVDDGSTDSTAEIVRSFEDRVACIYQRNQERSVARNAGLARATGQYLAFLDADDWWLPGKLERQIAHAEAQSRPGPDLQLGERR